MKRVFGQASMVLAMVAAVALGGHAVAQEGVAGQPMSTATAKQKIEFTNKVIVEMQDGLKDVERMLDDAHKEGNPDKIRCVEDKLASLRALKEVTVRAQGAMTEALASSDPTGPERADHELRKVGIAVSKFRQIYSEAAACVGESSVDGTAEVAVNQQGLTDQGETDEQVGDVQIDEDPPQYTPFE